MQDQKQLQNQTSNSQEWRTRTYVMGAFLGAGMGLLSAYLFNRAAEENEEGKPHPIPTGTLLTLVLSVITLIRQIAESGKPKKK